MSALSEENVKLKQEVALLQSKCLGFESHIRTLESHLRFLKKAVFGPRSERIVSAGDTQLTLEGIDGPAQSLPEEEVHTIGEHKRKKRRKPKGAQKLSWGDDVPVVTEYIDIPDSEKVCPETGETLVKIGEEVTQKLAHKPGSCYVKEIVRPKYAFKSREEKGIFCAEPPEGILPRCKADESLLAEIVVSKFADHLPCYRLEDIFQRQGITITRQLMSQWVLKIGLALKPLHNEMRRAIFETGNIFVDETPIKMLNPGSGKTKSATMWVLLGGHCGDPPLRVYEFRDSRRDNYGIQMLKAFKGCLHSDKWGGYEKVAREPEKIWSPCWVHIRRYLSTCSLRGIPSGSGCLGKCAIYLCLKGLPGLGAPKSVYKLGERESDP